MTHDVLSVLATFRRFQTSVHSMEDMTYARDQKGIRIDLETPSPRFSVNDERSFDDGIAYLTTHGYAVFSDVMSEEEVAANKNLLWNFLENIGGQRIQRDRPDTWSNFWRVKFHRSRRLTFAFVR